VIDGIQRQPDQAALDKQSKAKQSKAKQSKAKQNKAKQNKTKQSKPSNSFKVKAAAAFNLSHLGLTLGTSGHILVVGGFCSSSFRRPHSTSTAL
jgi:hypothetical protein